MGCGSTRAAVAPQCVFADVVPRQGSFSGVVPDDAVPIAKRGWEADAGEQADLPSDQLKGEKEQQELEGSRKEPRHDIPPLDYSMQMKAEEKMDSHQAEDAGPQAPPIAPSGPGGEQENKEGKELAPLTVQRAHTCQDEPGAEKIEKQTLCLNENMVPEPPNLQVYESYNYNPTKEHFAEGHPLAPCWPSHMQHIKRIHKHLAQFRRFPDHFTDLVLHKRAKMHKKRHQRSSLPEEDRG